MSSRFWPPIDHRLRPDAARRDGSGMGMRTLIRVSLVTFDVDGELSAEQNSPAPASPMTPSDSGDESRASSAPTPLSRSSRSNGHFPLPAAHLLVWRSNA
jgi:hypothetical protein